MKNTTKKSIEIAHHINETPFRIFNALVLGPEIEKWFASGAFTDPVKNGYYLMRFLYHDTTLSHERKGQFLEVSRPEFVAYTWMDHTRVSFTLEPVGNSTNVTLIHDGWEEGEEREMLRHADAWNFFLYNLKKVLEGGEDERAELRDMITSGMTKDHQHHAGEAV